MKGKGRIVISSIIIMVLLLGLGMYSLKDVYKNREGYREKLIRLHVIANSDSDEDQSIKLKVRDEILKEMTPKFEDSSSIEETKDIVLKNIDYIKSIAKKELDKYNKEYDVDVLFGDYDFPTKSYGSFTLPAGNYQALRVVIGEGVGQNWWCVMFPPLCFIDMKNGVTDKKTNENLKEVLTEEEYNMVLNSEDEKDIPIKLKFKIVEVLENNKTRFANLFSNGI